MPTPEMNLAAAVQEGSRWINGRPSGTELAEWFKHNVKLDEGLDPEKYVSGVVLISGKETIKVAKEAENGAVVIVDEERLVHTPYAKVETRIAYFWDLMRLKEGEWVGVIEPAPIPRMTEGTIYNANLPEGFFALSVSKAQGGAVKYIGCSMRVRILKSGTISHKEVKSGSPKFGVEQSFQRIGTPIAEFPAGTKLVPTLQRNGNEDPFALMKAETGAIGRALGFAGMLVIPGSGVATAEDMEEAMLVASQGTSAGPTIEPTAAEPVRAQTPDEERDTIAGLLAQLEAEKPEKFEEIREWASSRKPPLNLSELTDGALRGVRRKVEQALAT